MKPFLLGCQARLDQAEKAKAQESLLVQNKNSILVQNKNSQLDLLHTCTLASIVLLAGSCTWAGSVVQGGGWLMRHL